MPLVFEKLGFHSLHFSKSTSSISSVNVSIEFEQLAAKRFHEDLLGVVFAPES